MKHDRVDSPGMSPDDSPPSETWLFAQLLLGKPIPRIVSPEARARARREELERLAMYSSRQADELRQLDVAEAKARHDREILEWAAGISTRAQEQLRNSQRNEAEEREAWRRAGHFCESYCAGLIEWNETDHPRQPKGTPVGGEFAPKGSGGDAAAVGRATHSGNEGATPANAQLSSQGLGTKPHLPANHRGIWISGTKGHGVFRYNNSPENRQAGLAGKEVRFENQHIAIGGFPAESYYGGSATSAGVEIDKVTGLKADGLAADEAMRKKLGEPNWQRPKGYRWNHAGEPGSNLMELVRESEHIGVAHKGSAAAPRAQARGASARAATGRAMGALTVYLAARDVLKASGVLQPDYEVAEHETYHFRAEDGSVFIVHPRGLFSSARREYVEGPRKGQTERITGEEVEQHRKQAEAEFGKYIPGSLFKEPRFIPGKQRKSLPLITYPYGVPHDAGWIDEKGVHHYAVPRPLPI